MSTPSLGQRLIWRLEAFAYGLYTAFLRALPVDSASDFGAWLLGWVGPLTPVDKIVRTNLRLCFPEADDARIDYLAKAQWREFGRFAAENPILDRLTPASGRVEVVGVERLQQIARDKTPVVFISGHFSSFEIMSATILWAGIPCQITYRAANNPYFEKIVRESRFRYGVRMFAPKGGDGSREILAAMARGESVALMNDQKFNGGVEGRFFGHTVHTAPGPTRFALRFGTVLQPMSVERIKGAHFRVIVHDPIPVEDTGNRAADIAAGVAKVNAFIEARVRAQPEQWFWVHKRFPNEVYKRSDARRKGPA